MYYLNHKWSKLDGGELRIFDRECSHVVADINPVLDRLVLFFSDKRVPHEVLPTHKERFAITHWFYDKEERAAAEAMLGTESACAVGSIDWLLEQRRIETQIARFEAEQGMTAEIFAGAVLSSNGTDSPRARQDDHLKQTQGHLVETTPMQLDALD